ncbi:PEGA domain-containing protein [Myxococcota bacterium]|nr:PEGA domain-containing protein [Myxococcota bacterium]
MSDENGGPEPNAARLWLGLSQTASSGQCLAAYWRLRNHLESRARHASTSDDRVRANGQLHRLHRDFVALEQIQGSLQPKPPGPTSAPTRLGRSSGWITAAVLALVVLALLWAGSTRDRDPSPLSPGVPAQLTLEADPIEAELWVRTGEDERVILTGPADGTSQSLPAGEYSIAVLHPDCPDSWSENIQLEAGESRRYAPKICQGEGQIQVRSNVKQDRLIVDGRDLGLTGETLHTLRAGAHHVRVEKSGHITWEGDVVLKPDQQIELFAELAKSAAPSPPASPPPSAKAAPAPQPAAQNQPTGAAIARAAGRLNGSGTPAPLRTGKGGSKSWHAAIVEDLVGQNAQNGSGTRDTTEEVQSIPCATWIEIEKSYETGGLAVEMTHLYGFDGSEAPANTLGIAPAVRSYAYDRMKSCGLRARK